MPTNKRVFIADPSFENWCGHYAGYDMAVKAGLNQAGAEAVVLANISVEMEAVGPESGIFKVFSRTAWGVVTGPSTVKKPLHIFLLQLAGLILVLQNRLFRPIAVNFPKICDLSRRFIRVILPMLLPRTVQRLFSFLWRALKRCCPTRDFLPPIFQEFWRALGPTIYELHPAHWRLWLGALPCLTEYYELLEFLEERNFQDGDLIFAQMITGHCLPMWGLAASWVRRKRQGELIVLFRYPHYFLGGANLGRHPSLRAIEHSFLSGRLRGATDSALLAKEYANFLAVPLVVYPIPHIPELKPRPVSPGRPLRCVSLGNARAEKGILEIFEAIRILETEGKSKLFSFGLQVNDPDSLCAEQVAIFMAENHPSVEFFTSPLSPQAYEELLAGFDVVLAPYWADVYSSRTSGVAMEGLGAGKIIITSDNTWMSALLVEFDGAYKLVNSRNPRELAMALAEIEKRREKYQAKAAPAAERARAVHNPQAIAANILYGPARQAVKPGDRVMVCTPFNNFNENKAGNATRTTHLCQILKDYDLTLFTVPQSRPEHSKNAPPYRLVAYPGPTHNLFTLVIRLFTFLFWLVDTSEIFLLMIFKGYDRNRDFRLCLTQSIVDQKAVFVEYTFHMKHIALYAKALGLPVVLTAHDRHAPSCHNRWRYKLIDKWEKEAAGLADVFYTVARQEHEYFENYGLKNILAPNSCDIQKRSYSAQKYRDFVSQQNKAFSKPFFLFVGSCNGPNMAANTHLKYIAGEARKYNLPWDFVVAGSCAVAEDSYLNYIALGMVDDDVLEGLYDKCAMVVSPLLGGTGASLKTVEAMGHGKIVFGAAATFRSLDVKNGRECFIEDDPNQYIPRLKALLEAPNSAENMRTVAKNAASFGAAYDYRVCMKPYADFIQQWPQNYNGQ